MSLSRKSCSGSIKFCFTATSRESLTSDNFFIDSPKSTRAQPAMHRHIQNTTIMKCEVSHTFIYMWQPATDKLSPTANSIFGTAYARNRCEVRIRLVPAFPVSQPSVFCSFNTFFQLILKHFLKCLSEPSSNTPLIDSGLHMLSRDHNQAHNWDVCRQWWVNSKLTCIANHHK